MRRQHDNDGRRDALHAEPSTSESPVPVHTAPAVRRRREAAAWVPPVVSAVVVALAIGTHWPQVHAWVTTEIGGAPRTDAPGPLIASVLGAPVRLGQLPPPGHED